MPLKYWKDRFTTPNSKAVTQFAVVEALNGSIHLVRCTCGNVFEYFQDQVSCTKCGTMFMPDLALDLTKTIIQPTYISPTPNSNLESLELSNPESLELGNLLKFKFLEETFFLKANGSKILVRGFRDVVNGEDIFKIIAQEIEPETLTSPKIASIVYNNSLVVSVEVGPTTELVNWNISKGGKPIQGIGEEKLKALTEILSAMVNTYEPILLKKIKMLSDFRQRIHNASY